MKININGRFLTQNLTGVQRFAFELTSNLIQKTNNISVITPRTEFAYYGIDPRYLVRTGIFNGHLWEQTDLRFYSQKDNTALLINLGNTAPVYFKNQFITIHDLSYLVNPQWFSKSFAAVYRTIVPNIVRYSEKIITVSEFSKSEIVRHFNINPSKIEVIYNAVSSEIKFNPETPDPQNKYGRYFLAVSSIDPRKNLSGLIQAYQSLKLNNVKLIIVGARNSIFNSANMVHNSSDNIIFANRVDDYELASLYQNAVCLVFPSFYEGFGLPPIEAMKFGCPVIVSNNSSLPEVCGDAAFYIDPHNTKSIADGMQELLRNEMLRKDLIAKGLKRSADFSWTSSADKLLKIIKER